MANIKLQNNNWEASGIYDIDQQKTQRQINAEQADLKSAFQLFDDIPGSTQTVNFGSDGKPSSIVYTVNGVAARTDTFTWGSGTVTETRTLADGKHITFTTNLTTLVTTISDIEEAS